MNRNENWKTLWFLVAAVVVVAVAWLSRPTTAIQGELAERVKKLFPDLKDPEAVDSLQVLRYDQGSGKSLALEVAKLNGLWVIPTHSKYPADAKDHLAAAANSLIDLTILGPAPGFGEGSPDLDPATLRKAHNRFGVVDPDPKNVKSSDDGVGTRVTMKDAAGHELASAIIGKAVPEQSDQYYVRKAGMNPVYVVKLDAGKLSVRFDEWIEPNLLSLNTLDLKKIEIKDYTVALTPMRVSKDSDQIVLAPLETPKGEFVLDTPSGDQPWKLVQERAFDAAKDDMVPKPMAADEELNTTNLDGLKSALEDLKIVDVERKPNAVPANLRVGSVDDDTRETLIEKGFFVVRVSKDPQVPQEILSNAGDITLQMADGVRYILRFGATKGESIAAEMAKKKGDAKYEKDDKSKDDSPGMDRYLFVTTDFNPDAIAKPVVEKVPEEKAAEKTPEKKADSKEAKPAKGDVKKDDTKKEEPKKDVPAKSADAKKDAPKKVDVKKDDAKKVEPKKDEPAKGGDVKKDEPKKDDVKKDEAKKDEPKKDDAKKDDATTQPLTPEALAEKRKQIETENKRRQEEYEGKVTAGKKHAKELSDRFAQWYYVIPGQTYAKIHLNRQDIVKKKEPPKDTKDTKDAAGHDHDHDHSGPESLPSSPAATLEQLKKDAPAAEKK